MYFIVFYAYMYKCMHYCTGCTMGLRNYHSLLVHFVEEKISRATLTCPILRSLSTPLNPLGAIAKIHLAWHIVYVPLNR